jgi:hypothetical protein
VGLSARRLVAGACAYGFRRADLLQPARVVGSTSRLVHEPVDGLCKNTSNLCTVQGYRGIQAAGRTYYKPAAMKNTIHILWTEEERLFPHTTPQ